MLSSTFRFYSFFSIDLMICFVHYRTLEVDIWIVSKMNVAIICIYVVCILCICFILLQGEINISDSFYLVFLLIFSSPPFVVRTCMHLFLRISWDQLEPNNEHWHWNEDSPSFRTQSRKVLLGERKRLSIVQDLSHIHIPQLRDLGVFWNFLPFLEIWSCGFHMHVKT